MTRVRALIAVSAPLVWAVLLLAGILQLRSGLLTAGAVGALLAMAGLVYSIRRQSRVPLAPDDVHALRAPIRRVSVWLAVVILSATSVINVADDFTSPATDRLAAVTFVGSVCLGLVAAWWGRLGLAGIDLITGIRANRLEAGVVTALLLIALALRTSGLSDHPYPWTGDEASIGSEAGRILDGSITNYFDTGWSSQSNWSFVPTAIAETMFGRNYYAIRIISAVAGTLAVACVWLLARELFHPAVGVLAAAFLATLPYHVHFSRLGVANIIDSLVSALMFWLMVRGLRTHDYRHFYSGGAIAGLSIYTYAGTRLVVLLALLLFVFLTVRHRDYLRASWRHLVAFAGALAVSAAPQAAYFFRHPQIFLGRLGQEGILLNGWLAGQVAETGRSAVEILWVQFTRTMMVFIASPAPGNMFNSPEPYLTTAGVLLFLLGMGFALAHVLEPRGFIPITWFWAPVFMGGVLTLNPPANTRLLMTAPIVAILMALGAWKSAEYVRAYRLIPHRLVILALLGVVSLITYQHVRFYMFEYRSRMYFEDANSEFAMEAGKIASRMRGGVRIFVLGEPRVFAGFPTLPFLAPDKRLADLRAPDVATLQLVAGEKVAFFAIPENRALLARIAQKYPGGESGLQYRRPRPGEILFEYYVVAP
jgi:4-amino-4-deoxy-L-arabinose transferase-like glycosyltransferase